MANPEVDGVDIEPEEEDLMDEDVPTEDAYAAPAPKLKSTITGGKGGFAAGAYGNRKTKGRGFRDDIDRSNRYAVRNFESLHSGGDPGPQKCILSCTRLTHDILRSIGGWIILVNGVHEEAQEDDLHEAFAEYGERKKLHLNLDGRTGFVKDPGCSVAIKAGLIKANQKPTSSS